MTSQFQNFDGEHLTPLTEAQSTQFSSRRMTDTNLEIIAHKLSRIADDLRQVKEDNTKAIESLAQSMRYTHATLTEATEKATHAAEVAKESVREAVSEAMGAAYPNGDPHGHLRYHEASIQKAEASAEFWKNMKSELSKYGLIGFTGWALYALWQAVLHGPPK